MSFVNSSKRKFLIAFYCVVLILLATSRHSSAVVIGPLKLPTPHTNHQSLEMLRQKQYTEANSNSDNSLIPQSADIIASSDVNKTTEPSESLSVIELAICGAFASAFGDFVMHPVDTIKVIQQTSSASVGILATAVNIFKQAGIAGFYPGVAPYCIADGISGAIKFAVFEVSKSFSEEKLDKKWHPLGRFVCAAGAMIACSIALVPGEVIKTRLQSGLVNI